MKHFFFTLDFLRTPPIGCKKRKWLFLVTYAKITSWIWGTGFAGFVRTNGEPFYSHPTVLILCTCTVAHEHTNTHTRSPLQYTFLESKYNSYLRPNFSCYRSDKNMKWQGFYEKGKKIYVRSSTSGVVVNDLVGNSAILMTVLNKF